MKQRIAIFMTMVMALVTCFSICPSTVKAETDSAVVETHTCTVNGVERTLTLYDNGKIYLKVGELDPIYVFRNSTDLGFDEYGTIWITCDADTSVNWWNYDLQPDKILNIIPRPTTDDPSAYVDNVESLVFDANNKFVIGYKTFDNETCPLLSLDEMRAILSSEGEDPTPTPTPSTNPGSNPAPTPVVTPSTAPQVTQSPTPVVTPEPTVAPEETPAPSNSTKVTIKKKSGFTCLYTGTKVTSQYKLKKGTLTWKSGSKTKKIKAVKSAGFIKKSKNLIYMTKNGKVFTISSKGKKKTIVKKGAKKLVVKNKYVTKVKTKSGNINVTKK